MSTRYWPATIFTGEVHHYLEVKPAIVNKISMNCQVYTEVVVINNNCDITAKKCQNVINIIHRPVGTIKIGVEKDHICIKGNSAQAILGRTTELNTKCSYILTQAAHYSLPNDLVVNSCYVKFKSFEGVSHLISTPNQSIWIRHPY